MKKSHIIGIVIITISIVMIVGMMMDTITYDTFSEAIKFPEREFQVIGQLDTEKEIVYDPQTNENYFSFHLNDGKETHQVIFDGAKPRDFERAEQVVIIGQMANDHFKADKILMKCPSKYNDGKNPGEFQEFASNTDY